MVINTINQSSLICILLEDAAVFLFLYIQQKQNTADLSLAPPPPPHQCPPQEKVLHNIMPIFTFMGASIMRLDDSYSFQVITKTVQTVIPALIKVSREGRPMATPGGLNWKWSLLLLCVWSFSMHLLRH